MSERVKVVVRCRPFSEKEKQQGHTNIITLHKEKALVFINDPLDDKQQKDQKQFTFDSVFDPSSKQIDVYNATVRPIVESVLDGYNGTVFAYGQTGTGKTFSMEGIRDIPELKGIIPNSIHHIFAHIKASIGVNFLVRASYLEIYNEEIRDLSSPTPSRLELKESKDTGLYVKDLQSFLVKDSDEMDRLLEFGNKNRKTGATLMNAQSSRSHSIFTITIEASEIKDGQQHIRAGKLNLVDLAGSERQSKTGASGDRLKEASKINLSLSALGNVISALVDGKSTHIPYRDSKLTRLLQDSLGGNAKTLMIATLSPASYNYDESISTLRYANRAKNIKNKPIINEDPKDTMLRELQAEIAKLKSELESVESNPQLTASLDNVSSSSTKQQKSQVKEKRINSMEREIQVERTKIIESKDIQDSEKYKILEEIEARSKEIQKEKEQRQQIAEKLEKLQKQLLIGNVNLLDQEEQQREMIANEAARLEEQKQNEREIERQLIEISATKLRMEQSYATLQEEIIEKTKKLKKLWALFSNSKVEIKDLEQENQREREDLLYTIRAISKEIKLSSMIINQFIPTEFQGMLEQAASYDQDTESWTISSIELAGNNVKGRHSQEQTKTKGMQGYSRTPNAYIKEPSWSPLCVFQNVFPTENEPKTKSSPSRSSSNSNHLKQRPVSAAKRPTSNSKEAIRKDIVDTSNQIPVVRGLISKQVRYA